MDLEQANLGSHARSWNVHYQNWKTKIMVHDSASDPPLYTLTADGSRHLAVTKGYDHLVGSSTVHQWSSCIEVETKDDAGVSNSFEIRNDSILGGSPRYTSPVFNGQSMTWKNTAMSSKIIYTLLNEQQIALARFESSPRTKIGKLEIVGDVLHERQIDEIVVTLLTLLRRKLKTIQTNTIVAVT